MAPVVLPPTSQRRRGFAPPTTQRHIPSAPQPPGSTTRTIANHSPQPAPPLSNCSAARERGGGGGGGEASGARSCRGHGALHVAVHPTGGGGAAGSGRRAEGAALWQRMGTRPGHGAPHGALFGGLLGRREVLCVPLGRPEALMGAHEDTWRSACGHGGGCGRVGGGGCIKRPLLYCAHRVRTVAAISGQTPVHHPNMHPPKQPIEPWKAELQAQHLSSEVFWGCQ